MRPPFFPPLILSDAASSAVGQIFFFKASPPGPRPHDMTSQQLSFNSIARKNRCRGGRRAVGVCGEGWGLSARQAWLAGAGSTSGLGKSPASLTISGTASSHSIAWICTPLTPSISRSCWISSTEIFLPSVAGLVLLDAGHPLDQRIGHLHARHRGLHVAEHAGALGHDHAREDVGPLVQAQVARARHDGLERLDVVHALGLDEVGAGSTFFLQTQNADVAHFLHRRPGRPDEERGPPCSIGSPPSSSPSSRIFFSMATSWIESTS